MHLRKPLRQTYRSMFTVPLFQALIPSVECLTAPGGILFDLLSGHTDDITAVTLTSDGMRAVTSSLDDTIKLWDLRSGRVVKTLEGVGSKVTAIRTAKNNTVSKKKSMP